MGLVPESGSSGKTDYETPQALYKKLNDEFLFNIDAAASKSNAKTEVFFTEENDALTHRWVGNVFCNPPYGRGLGKWVEKAFREAQETARVVMLLPASTDTKWFHKYCMHAKEIRFVKGRIKFSNYTNSPMFASMIVVFHGEHDRPSIKSVEY